MSRFALHEIPNTQDGFFSCREVHLKGWSGLDTPKLVRMDVEVLLDAGWLRDVNRESGPLGGRPSARYQVNPRVWEWPPEDRSR